MTPVISINLKPLKHVFLRLPNYQHDQYYAEKLLYTTNYMLSALCLIVHILAGKRPFIMNLKCCGVCEFCCGSNDKNNVTINDVGLCFAQLKLQSIDHKTVYTILYHLIKIFN